jgi:hypothetical protein
MTTRGGAAVPVSYDNNKTDETAYEHQWLTTNTAEAMAIWELLGDELATRDPRGAAAPRADTVVSPEERGATAPTMAHTTYKGPRRL